MIALKRMQHRPLLIGSQQRGIEYIALTLLLRQQLVAVLEHRILVRALNLGGQSAFAIKTLPLGRTWPLIGNQPVKGVVAVMAVQGFA
jgi:hypothetical protein